MRFRLILGSLVAALVCGGGAMAVNYHPVAPKTVKEVMKIAHDQKEGLLPKIKGGNATDAEKKQLLDLYLDMLEGSPKKGDKDEFRALTNTLVLSAAKVVVGREGAIDELNKAADCKGCHSKHK